MSSLLKKVAVPPVSASSLFESDKEYFPTDQLAVQEPVPLTDEERTDFFKKGTKIIEQYKPTVSDEFIIEFDRGAIGLILLHLGGYEHTDSSDRVSILNHWYEAEVRLHDHDNCRLLDDMEYTNEELMDLQKICDTCQRLLGVPLNMTYSKLYTAAMKPFKKEVLNCDTETVNRKIAAMLDSLRV